MYRAIIIFYSEYSESINIISNVMQVSVNANSIGGCMHGWKYIG